MAFPGAHNDIAGAEFRHTFRGYDPEEVQAFVAEVALRVASLQREHEAALARLAEYGERDRATQIDQLTDDINRILHTAQTAAENLQARTEAAAAQLIESARSSATEVTSAADSDAYALRKDAWDMASKLLEDVVAHVGEVEKQAEQDALAIVGEGERNAHRRLAMARRDAENQLRAARLEGERIRVEAQGERDELVENARRASEAAQERTRALERRRDELLAEIERRQQAGTLEPGAAEIASTTVRVVRPGNAPDGPWETDDEHDQIRIIPPEGGTAAWADGTENVRVVQPPEKQPPEFLDGARIADEVRRMRDSDDTEEVAVTDPAETAVELAAEPSDDAPIPAQLPPGEVAESSSFTAGTGKGESALFDDESEPDDSGGAEPHSTQESDTPTVVEPPVAEESAPADESAEPVDVDQLEEDGASTEIDMLFGQLRGGELPQPRPQLEILPSRIDPASLGTEISEDTPLEDLVKPEPVDPFEIRDRLLLPITNRVLRAVKRELSDAQNVALNALRVDAHSWSPDSGPFAAAIKPEFAILENEAFGAGAAAAAELAGMSATRPKSSGLNGEPAVQFATDLCAALEDALATGIAHEHGVREQSSSVSRVYRAWRTDEAERRIRAIASAGYHLGMRAAFADASVQKLRLVIAGAGCVECRSRSEHLIDPVDVTISLPPLHDECSCTLVQN